MLRIVSCVVTTPSISLGANLSEKKHPLNTFKLKSSKFCLSLTTYKLICMKSSSTENNEPLK